LKKKGGYQFVKTSSEKNKLKEAMLSLPDLIIVNEDNLKTDTDVILRSLRDNTDYSITPIILVSSISDKVHRTQMLEHGIEIYIVKPLNEMYFFYTIKNISRLIASNRCISALTGLPGNVQIENEMKRRMSSQDIYAVLYMDLDNFKSYNDKYGFMNGDEVIKFTSDLIQESIQKYGIPGDFLGHIGGDDFVAIVNYENAKKIGRSVVKNFDARIKKFYNQEDATKGWIRVVNRKGKLEKYPIMTITVAMISNKYKKYNTTLDIGEDGAMIKKKAKTILGSTFLEDRRKNN
jgi:diguanylate cyclase (GGDEF)-like protein